jgi:hypothetical protein
MHQDFFERCHNYFTRRVTAAYKDAVCHAGAPGGATSAKPGWVSFNAAAKQGPVLALAFNPWRVRTLAPSLGAVIPIESWDPSGSFQQTELSL